jgi:hypothetical protein
VSPMNEEGAVCLGSDESAEKRKRGSGSSLKLAGARGEKERKRGAGSGRGHTEKGGGWRGREVGRRRGPARLGRGGSKLLR